MKLAEIPKLQNASPAEKIALIDELWASIPPESLSVPESHLTELGRRVAAVRENPTRALTADEARRRIRAKTGL